MDEPRPLVIICQYCQVEAPSEAIHCPSCGQPLPRHLLLQGEIVADDYQIVRLIGYGGMGEVYLAQHHLTGQQVAVKVLAMHLSEEVDLRIRFLDEARILARLDHPNIVMLHNFKQERERMFIIMQYVDGLSLDRIIESDGPMDSEQAALLFAPLADALGHAHETGIIHRDLKPSNIIVNGQGKARLTDFGIAKLTEGGANLTRTGTRVGTSWFMSPEQGLNKPADSRSDIYSLCVTLYNCLSGRLPFSGDSEYEVIKGHVELPPPPIFGSGDPLDQEVEAVVMQGLAKDPDKRFQTGNALRDALLGALTAHGQAVDLRATADGQAVVAIPKGIADRALAAHPPPPPGAARGPATTVDPVEELDGGEALVTPPLGSVALVGGEVNAPSPDEGRRSAVPMATEPPLPRKERAVDPARLRTPPGRPPAPGISGVVTGVLLREEVEGDQTADGNRADASGNRGGSNRGRASSGRKTITREMVTAVAQREGAEATGTGPVDRSGDLASPQPTSGVGDVLSQDSAPPVIEQEVDEPSTSGPASRGREEVEQEVEHLPHGQDGAGSPESQ